MISQLSDIEEMAIKILALNNIGLLEIPIDYELDEYDLRVFVPEDMREDFDYQLDKHPLYFIPSIISSFHDEYYFNELYKTPPPYKKMNHRFWLATKLMKYWSNKLEVYKMKRDMESKSTSSK